MKRYLLFSLIVLFALPAHAQFKPQSPGEYAKAYDARRDSVIQFLANLVPADDLTRGHYFHITPRAYLGIDMEWQLARLDSITYE